MKKSTVFTVFLFLFFFTSQAYSYSLHGTKWGSGPFGTGATITCSYMAAGININEGSFFNGPSADLDTIFPTGWKTEIERAFDAWSSVADLTFIEVPDSGAAFNSIDDYTNGSDIRIGAHEMDGYLSHLGHGFYPPPNGLGAAGDIHFDSSEFWTIGETWVPGTYPITISIFNVMAHELGHALGLGDSEDEDAMMYPFYSRVISGLHADDIAGIQTIYGPPVVNSEVPEPTSMMLFGMGVACLAFSRRKN